MSRLLQTNGIIIKEAESGEADRFLTVFTEDFGKIKLCARGARRIKAKLGGRLAFFSLLNIQFIRGKKRDIITDVYTVDNFLSIRNDLGKLKLAFYASAIIDNLIVASERDEKLWTLISWVFESIDRGVIPYEDHLLLRLFEVKLLAYLGYLPNFNENNPYSFKPGVVKILDTLARDHKNINKLTCAKKDLQDIKKATEIMMSVVY